MAVCATLLAAALGAVVHPAAQAGSTASVRTGSVTGAAPATSAPAPGAAVAPAAVGGLGPALDARINDIVAANPEYQIGVALLDVSDGAAASGEVRQYGVESVFVAASTAKVLAAEAFYHLVETGAASLDDPLGDYTAEFQLQAMIQQSDNDSWSLIMDSVGHAELTDYAASIGVDYSPESNTLTPADMARILAGLYTGTLLTPADTAQLLAFMQNTNYETLIPAAVPAGVAVFHKYGLLGGELHDAAILAEGGRAYALVAYTKGDDLDSVPERTEVIHQVTQAVADTLF
ncbi:serine hydrolase [Pseudarthrobacter sp. B907]